MPDRVPLLDLVSVLGGGTPNRDEPRYWGGDIPWATVKDLTSTTLTATVERITRDGLESSASAIAPAGSVVLATRIVPGKAALSMIDVAINQDLKVLVPRDSVDAKYLVYFLQLFSPRIEQMSAGSTVKGITLEALARIRVPLPRLAEQRRIAALLDRADAIRRKRRESLRLLDEFLRSAFLDTFGDPVRNEKGWEVVRLRDLLLESLRNGLSPAKGGVVTAQVLTLTAITGSRFQSAAVKTGQFAHPPHPDQIVRPDDFLICRGNGNQVLMGRARFPHGLPPDTIFPDTIIAARVDTVRVEPAYLEAIWATPVVRRALESASRTTSGIHKVNQKALESVRFPLPIVQEQRRYTAITRRVERLRERLLDARYSNLFDSLAQRAFRGEL